MAKAAKSLASGAAVLAAGLAVGILAMAGMLLVFDIGLGETEAYQTRSDLVVLDPSPRDAGSLSPSALGPEIRSSDPLTLQNLPTPTRLVISAIDVDAVISPVGLEPTPEEGSTVAIPDAHNAGWYEYGSAPGQPGATVLAGHVDLDGLRGVFWSLDSLAAGEIIEVHMSDDSIARYRVMRGTTFSRDDLPTDELFRRDGSPALHLITCGGAFNQNLGSYESNFVVTASPVYPEA